MARTTPRGTPVAVVDGPEHDHATADLDDAALVEAFRSGDASAYEELYRRYRPVLLRRTIELCGSESLAEDICQEAFIRAATHALRPQALTHFGPWLFCIARNLCHDVHRRSRRHGTVPLDDAEGTSRLMSTDVAALVEVNESLREVRELLGRLSPRHREVLVLREVEGLDYRTIADRLSMSVAAIETLLFRARARFRVEASRAAMAMAPRAA